MKTQKMHADEVDTDADLVRRLLASQFPEWAQYSIERVESAGTDHAIYRVGTDLSVRLPRVGWARGHAAKEHEWMPRLAPHLPLEIPTPLALGVPGDGYPWTWSVHRWVDGENIVVGRHPGLEPVARELATFLLALQHIDTGDAPRAGPRSALRGAPIAIRDTDTRAAIAQLRDEIDTGAALRVWDAALAVDEWRREPIWFHGDMLPGNLIVRDGRLRAVIDFSGLGVGDPACDLMIAWALFWGESRAAFRAAMDVDDATWTRGRGHALAQAAMFIPYYRDTNPDGVARARHSMAEVLADAP